MVGEGIPAFVRRIIPVIATFHATAPRFFGLVNSLKTLPFASVAWFLLPPHHLHSQSLDDCRIRQGRWRRRVRHGERTEGNRPGFHRERVRHTGMSRTSLPGTEHQGTSGAFRHSSSRVGSVKKVWESFRFGELGIEFQIIKSLFNHVWNCLEIILASQS